MKNRIIFSNQSYLNQLPGLCFAKTLDSHYFDITSECAHLLGWKKIKHCFGKKVYDLPCQASESAEEFIAIDQKLIATGKKIISLEIQQFNTGWRVLLVEKKPWYNLKNNIIGIFGQLTDIIETNLYQNSLLLHQKDQNIIQNLNKPIIYIPEKATSLALSQRQQECLFWLVRGKTIKHIASILHISSRIVEEHINKIKISLNCFSKAQLIEKSIQAGFLSYIPFDIFNNH